MLILARLGFIACTLCQVSLIAGVGYRVEQWGGKWGGKWDGMMGVLHV